MELAYNSLFTGNGSWGIGKVDMEDTKTSENYEIMRKSAFFFFEKNLGHILKKFRADHIGIFFFYT